MSFSRTNDGLSAMHIFLDVDLVVFVEGGRETHSASDAIEGRYNSDTHDIRFWEGIFSTFLPTVKAEFRSLGGNVGVREIGKMVADGSVSNVLAATDRDFEEYFHGGSKLRGCLRTWGYSWENDVCTTQVLSEAIYSYSGRSRASLDAQAEAEEILSSITRRLRRYVIADYMLHLYNKSLIPREKPIKFINEGTKKSPPSFREAAAINDFRIITAGRWRVRSSNRSIDPWSCLSAARDCCGHFIMEIYYRALIHLLQKHSKGIKMEKDFGVLCLVREFFDQFRGGRIENVYRHYEGQIDAVRPLLLEWGVAV